MLRRMIIMRWFTFLFAQPEKSNVEFRSWKSEAFRYPRTFPMKLSHGQRG